MDSEESELQKEQTEKGAKKEIRKESKQRAERNIEI